MLSLKLVLHICCFIRLIIARVDALEARAAKYLEVSSATLQLLGVSNIFTAPNMNRSLEPALTSLIPTYNGALPPELLQLARSILSQSQSKVAALKPEEEAARSYICAHLACDRSDLPIIIDQVHLLTVI